MAILMCRPDYYDIQYEINPWMNIKNQSIQELAITEWQKLYQHIQLLDQVKLIDPVRGLPDLVFTANAGLVYQQQVFVASFAVKERQKESDYFKTWFLKAGFNVIEFSEAEKNDCYYFEGAGDALFMGNQLITGYGFRSRLKSYQHPFFHQFDLVCCELVDPYFYHLDTCFCPLTPSLAIWYPNAFSQPSQIKLQNHFNLIPVETAEARRFACNAVVINDTVIIPSGCPHLNDALRQQGFQVLACDMSEYIKAGGACKCLTLTLSI